MKTRLPSPLPATLAVALSLGLAGCMVGPDYHRPAVDVPAHYQPLPGWTPASPAAAAGPKGDWWTAFHDPLLDRLEPMVSVSNQSVRQAYANYRQALAEVRLARSGLFPVLGLTGSATRQHSASGNVSSSAGFGRSVSDSGSLEGNISWAPDLWGEVRRGIEQNTATAQASEATLANATLSEQIALATTVIELRINDASAELLRQTVASDEQYLRVVTEKDRAGTVPPSDLIAARTQLENAQASLIGLGVARAQYAHAIAVLVGKNPQDLDIPPGTALPTLPEIPVGVPSTLLQRRPDIAVAERKMAAQNAAIGVAVAAYYPTVSLSAVAGFTQSPLAGLLHAANRVWSLGADVGQTLFDGGQRSAQVDAARAAYDAAEANYRGTVLSAFQNVENDLSGLHVLARQAEVLDAAVRDATRGTEIARREYEAGTVDYTTVATAQATQLSAQQSALSVQAQRLLSTASLIGDLGGGWSADALQGASLQSPRPTPSAQPH
ncbi:efflux transporter outer membrane subunit [Pandoraea sp.]|uniref:efflux transporter outer membrane subunit n=1 Tax=Pandoraea sp. TaxID=1883445 RepID=UPI001214F8D2|nr:efflux transporter outer membrane subunit [Pandoraea sp.]TAL57201.1 MAG: efflux transporter outer membrane subunit [Pandoraea sp.]TAM16551.1 MAG: efflux transporter outer membrane subunit [Pandoraea sp.]